MAKPRRTACTPGKNLGIPGIAYSSAGTAQVLLQAVQRRGDGLPSPTGKGLSGCGPELALTGVEASAQEKTTSGPVAGSSLQGSLWGESTTQASS